MDENLDYLEFLEYSDKEKDAEDLKKEQEKAAKENNV